MKLVIEPQSCLVCGHDTGTKILCDMCRIELTPSQVQKFDRIFQHLVIELYGNACVDCDHQAETVSGELCADHLDTKGSMPELRYDLSNAVCRCLQCHNKRGTAEIPKVPKDKSKLPKQTVARQVKASRMKCKCRPGCNLIPLANGYCYPSQKKVTPLPR